MITAQAIYFIGIIDKLNCILGFAATIFAFCTMGFFIGFIANSEQHYASEKIYFDLCKKWATRFALMASITFSIYSFMPNSKTIAAMYLIPSIANNEKLHNIGTNSLDILEELTKKWIIDLKKDAHEKLDSGDI